MTDNRAINKGELSGMNHIKNSNAQFGEAVDKTEETSSDNNFGLGNNNILDPRLHELSMRRADHIRQGLEKFDGLNLDNYIKWRHNIVQAMTNSFIKDDHWACYYVIMGSLTNVALSSTRSKVVMTGDGKGTLKRLWEHLDAEYINS